MKLGPLTKLDKRIKKKSKEKKKSQKKKWMMMSCQKIVMSSFFGFLASLEQSGGWIPDTESAKFMFSLIVTFCLRKTENRTKKPNTALTRQFFGQRNAIFFAKNADISKLKGAQVLKGIFSETTYGCARTCQI